MSVGPWLWTLFTRGAMGYAKSRSDGQGTRSPCSSAGSSSVGSSQRPRSPGAARPACGCAAPPSGRWGRGHDGEGAKQLRPVWKRRVAPRGPQPGERQRRTVGRADGVGLTSAREALPFVEPIGRDQAAAAPEARPEGGRGCHRLGPRVDEARADPRVLCPGRNKAPAEGWRGPAPPRRGRRARPMPARSARR